MDGSESLRPFTFSHSQRRTPTRTEHVSEASQERSKDHRAPLGTSVQPRVRLMLFIPKQWHLLRQADTWDDARYHHGTHNFLSGLAQAVDAVHSTRVRRLPVVHDAPLV